MNYIGSKLKLCQEFIPNTIKAVCGDDLSNMVFCDLFAGTGIVGRTFKTLVKKVISNDIEYYSYIINKNYIENHTEIPKKNDYIEELNDAKLIENGFIYKNYCFGGSGERQFFQIIMEKRLIQLEQKSKSGLRTKEYHLTYIIICYVV